MFLDFSFEIRHPDYRVFLNKVHLLLFFHNIFILTLLELEVMEAVAAMRIGP